MLDNIFSVVKATESVQNCLLCVGVAIILGIIISYTHKATTKTTQNFLLTLGILPVLVEVIILLASGQVEVSLAVRVISGTSTPLTVWPSQVRVTPLVK